MGRYRSVVKKVWTLATASNFINRLVGIVRTRIFPWKRSDMAGDPLKKGRYTEYSNKIGLFDKNNKQFIGNSPEVVLSFPFKDAVLEAGMTKEDAGREERFLNIKIDAKDIDTLEDPKVLTNFKYIDKDGEKELDENSDIEFFDKNGELKQNLLIKGNNLLALHTLKEKLAGQVKLIYIDPPYYFAKDKVTDTFSYNPNFKLSTWLTFMKNRLEVAKELLDENGVILVSIDEDGQAYLKVLLDEIFGIDNSITTFVWRRSGTGGLRGQFPITTHEYVLSFAKNKDKITKYWNAPYSESSLNDFRYEDERGKYKTQALYLTSLKQTKSQAYPIETPDGKYAVPRPGIGSWRFIEDTYKEALKNGDIEFKETPNSPLMTTDGVQSRYNIYTKQYMSDEGTNPPSIIPDDIVGQTRTAKAELKAIFGKDAFSYAKPESLIYYLMKMITDEGDIVLDYHLGSGTTAAVAHKLGRRWIGVEQMDYIEGVAKERIRNVICGEQGGISKDVNWHGGGSFVYCELKKYNQDFIDRIMEAITIPELEEIYEDMQKNAFLKFFFDKNEFEKDENFRSKSLDERKELLVGILDENQFYLNLSEMNDAKYKITDAERVLTEKFYQIKKDEVEDDEE